MARRRVEPVNLSVGDRVYSSNFPPDYEPTMFDGPRLKKWGTVLVVIRRTGKVTVHFDNGDRAYMSPRHLYKETAK